jgi:hypothetical protein
MTEIMARNKEAKQAAIRLRRELKELQVRILNFLRFFGRFLVFSDLEPRPDPKVFEPPGSGSVIICTDPDPKQRSTGSGS